MCSSALILEPFVGWGVMSKRTSGKKPSGLNGSEVLQQVVLRIPESMFDRLNLAVQRRSIKIPRHTWLLNAVMEKLTRELPDNGGEHGSK